MLILIIINLAVFLGIIVLLTRFRQPRYSLSRQVMAGLIAGLAFGFAMQFAYSGNPDVLAGTLEWTNVVGTTYVNLLKMIVMPLVLVMMIAAVVKMREVAALGKFGGIVIGILIGTTMIAALVGILVVNLFGLTAEGLTEGARELARADVLLTRQESLSNLGLADRPLLSRSFYSASCSVSRLCWFQRKTRNAVKPSSVLSIRFRPSF